MPHSRFAVQSADSDDPRGNLPTVTEVAEDIVRTHQEDQRRSAASAQHEDTATYDLD